MPALTIRQTFKHGAVPASKMDAVAREVLAELADPTSEASTTAAAAGLDPAALADARVEITEARQGLDPIFTPIIVGIAVSASSKVAETLWKEVIWPRIRRRLGKDALGDAAAPTEEL
jgi:hypothetical protein